MESTPRWTLEELCRRAALALRSVPGARPPDARAVRWYAGTGLVDRPVGGRGRAARYGLRHLRQLVAIRRLQSQGWALADIQGQLAGVDDEGLRALAPLPDLSLLEQEAAVEPLAAEPAGPVLQRDRFWARGPQVVLAPPSPARQAPDGGPGPEAGPSGAAAAPEAGAVRLAAGVVLVLPRRPSTAELALVVEAAAPLVTVLASLGLSDPVRSDPVPPSPSTVHGGAS